MSDFSNYAETEIANWVAGIADPDAVSAGRWLALFTAVSNAEAGTGTEVSTSGTAYARETLTGGILTESGGALTNPADIEFAEATGAGFGTVTHAAIVDTASGAFNAISIIKALAAPKTIASGDVFRIKAGDLDFAVQ
jgi:hypothetical protein